MKRASILVLSLVVALCFALSLAGCASNDYKPELKSQTVDDSALNTPGTLRVGVNASNPPYAAEASGSIVGIDVDTAAALADAMGLKLELVDVGTAADQAFTKDSVDIVMGVTEQNAAYWLSDPYMTSAIALFSLTQNAQAPTASGSFKVAAQSSSMSAWEVTDHYGEGCLENTTDPNAAFDALSTGSVNYVAADSTIGEYVVHTSGIEAYPIALLQETTPLHVAVSTNNKALQQAVSQALTSLVNGGVIDVVQGYWLGGKVDISSLKVIPAPAKSEDTQASEGDTVSSGNTATTSTDSSNSSGESNTSSTSNSGNSGNSSRSSSSTGSTGTSTSSGSSSSNSNG